MDLTTGTINQHIRTIAVPASLGFFFNTMYNVVDTMFAGFISTNAIAALSISFPLFFIMIAFMNGISTGSSALIANALGARRKEAVKQISAQILTFSVIVYLILLPICLWASPFLFRLLGAGDELLSMALTYMNIIFIGSIFFILLYSANSILLAHGNSITLRNYLIGGFVLNCLFVPWFLFGGLGIPSLGIAGIGMATVLVMILGFIYILREVIKDNYLSGTTWKDFIPNKHYFLAIAQQSIPASINMMTIGIGIFVITYFVKNFGTAAVAAYGICTRIEQISLLPTFGLTIAALTIIGQNNGARKGERIEETIRKCLLYGLILISVGAIAMFLFPRQLISIFSTDPDVMAVGSGYLRIAAFTSWAYIILSINVSALQGIKRPNYPMIIGVLRQLLAPGVVFYVSTILLDLGIQGIWWGIFSITWMAAIVTHYYCKLIVNKEFPK